MIKFIDPDHPFYRPLWIRVLIVAFCAGWTAIEFTNVREPLWGMVFLAVTAYAGCALLIFYKPKQSDDDKADKADKSDKPDTTDGPN